MAPYKLDHISLITPTVGLLSSGSYINPSHLHTGDMSIKSNYTLDIRMPISKGLKIGMAVGCLVLVPIIILVTLEYFNIGPLITDADKANFAMQQEPNSTISSLQKF